MGDAWYWTFPAPDDLDEWLVCSWEARPHGSTRLTPDGCSDLLCTSAGHVLLCGPEHRSWAFTLPDDVTAVGIRFRAGQVRALFDLDVSTLTDRQVPLRSIVGAERSDVLASRRTEPAALSDRRRDLLDWFRLWAADREPDTLSDAIVQLLVHSPRASQQTMAADLAMSPRTLHRRAVERFGYGTATLARLLRFQRLVALALMADQTASLGDLAAEAGYADHAHLVRDCRDISDQPPKAFLAEHFPTFPDLSDPYKTSQLHSVTIEE